MESGIACLFKVGFKLMKSQIKIIKNKVPKICIYLIKDFYFFRFNSKQFADNIYKVI